MGDASWGFYIASTNKTLRALTGTTYRLEAVMVILLSYDK